MNRVVDAVKKMFTAWKSEQDYWVAYSGGVDSHVLLHAVASHKPATANVKAIHIHHGLHPEADRWSEHCAEQAKLLGISLEIKRVNAKPAHGQSPEAAAREARYQAIATLLHPGDSILTAHNQNDQAETLLLQLMRGAGVKGLAAMPKLSSLGLGKLYRPLLNVSREAIEEYAALHNLRWVEDHSNNDLHFDRNFLRQRIMPILTQRWPSVTQTVARSAMHCGQVSTMMDAFAKQDLVFLTDRNFRGPSELCYDDDDKTVCSDSESDPSLLRGNNRYLPLSIEKLLTLSKARQSNVLRYWISAQNLPEPSTSHLDNLFRTVINASQNRTPCAHWPGAEVRRFKGYLYAMTPLTDFDTSIEIVWDRQSPVLLPGDLGILHPDDKRLHSNGDALAQQEGPLTIRFRRGGETICLKGRTGTHELKKLFQEWEVLPWQRDRVPLIFTNNTLTVVLLSLGDYGAAR